MVNEYYPDYVAPPGETLKEVLEDRKMTVEQLAEKMGFPLPIIEGILIGDSKIDNVIACLLERELGVNAQFWLRLEKSYREFLKGDKRND